MENQHRKIQGYRELSQEEIDLMNEVKAMGVEFGNLLEKIRLHVMNQVTGDVGVADRHYVAQPMKWHAMAKTEAQQAIMFAVRGVAQPDDGF